MIIMVTTTIIISKQLKIQYYAKIPLNTIFWHIEPLLVQDSAKRQNHNMSPNEAIYKKLLAFSLPNQFYSRAVFPILAVS